MTFTLKRNLQRHISTIHENKKIANPSKSVKEFKCDSCSKSFVSLSNLQRHEKTIHEGTKYQCEICQNLYHSVAQLSMHFDAIHKKKKDFRCELCGKQCAWKSNLKRHLKI